MDKQIGELCKQIIVGQQEGEIKRDRLKENGSKRGPTLDGRANAL